MSADPDMWTYSERGPMQPEESWARLLRNHGHWALLGFGIFAVEDKASGEFLGEAGCSDFHRQLGSDFDSLPEISWAICSRFQSLGYASEAALAALDWMDRTHGSRPTVCLIHRDNGPSLRVAAKLGYRRFRDLEYRGYPATLLRRPAG